MQSNDDFKKEVTQYHRLTNLYFNDSLYVENDNLRQIIFLLLQNPTNQFNKSSYFNVSQDDQRKIKRSSECTTKNGNLGEIIILFQLIISIFTWRFYYIVKVHFWFCTNRFQQFQFSDLHATDFQFDGEYQ